MKDPHLQHSGWHRAILRTLLAPAVRFSVRASVGIQQLIEVVKEELVRAASEELRLQGIKPNSSRVSLITGIHRREVTRLSQEEIPPPIRPSSVFSRIIHTWEHDPRFTNRAGQPRVLGEVGEANEFRKLVESISKDINPTTVLYELERTGIIKRSKRGLKLERNFQSFADVPEKGLQILGRDLETLTDAVSENVFSTQETKNVHLRTEFDSIYVRDIPEIRKWLLKEGMEFHKRLRVYLAEHDHDLTPLRAERSDGQVVVTLFSWTTPEDIGLESGATKKTENQKNSA